VAEQVSDATVRPDRQRLGSAAVVADHLKAGNAARRILLSRNLASRLLVCGLLPAADDLLDCLGETGTGIAMHVGAIGQAVDLPRNFCSIMMQRIIMGNNRLITTEGGIYGFTAGVRLRVTPRVGRDRIT
jgi:hypothetical protein